MNDTENTIETSAELSAKEYVSPTASLTAVSPAPDYIPSPEDLSKGEAAFNAATEPSVSTEPPLIDNKDTEQDARPVYVGTVNGKLQGAFWHRKDGSTALSIRFAWECTGDVKSVRYEQVNGRVTPKTINHPPGEVISEFRQIRDDGPSRDGMSDAERISMETISKYYLSAVNQMYAGPGGAKVPDATVAKWQKELVQEGLRASSKDKVQHRCVSDIINRPVILVLEAGMGQSKVLDERGVEVFNAKGKPAYKDDPAAPKRQKINVRAVAKAK